MLLWDKGLQGWGRFVEDLNIEKYAKIDATRNLLMDGGFLLNSDVVGRIDAHLSLVRSYGSAFGVVSDGDIKRGAREHVVDSLSLVPYLDKFFEDGRRLVDVGSGGGFPGLVCAAAFPESEVVLIERSEKKCAFLRRCVGGIGLENVSVMDIPFEEYPWSDGPVVVTVRGLERAAETVPELVAGLAVGSTCFWLTGSKVAVDFGPRFHVEQIVDNWSTQGLRRGLLYSISVTDS